MSKNYVVSNDTPVIVRIWDKERYDYEKKVVSHEELHRLWKEYETKAKSMKKDGRKQFVLYAKQYGIDGEVVKKGYFSTAFDFYTQPIIGTKSDLWYQIGVGVIPYIVKVA